MKAPAKQTVCASATSKCAALSVKPAAATAPSDQPTSTMPSLGAPPGELERTQQIRTPAVVGMRVPIRRHHRGAMVGQQSGEGPDGGARVGLHAVPQQDGGSRRTAEDVGQSSGDVFHRSHRHRYARGFSSQTRGIALLQRCRQQVVPWTGGQDPRLRRLPGRVAGAPGRRRRAGADSTAGRHDHRSSVGDAGEFVRRIRFGDVGADRTRQCAAARDHRRPGRRRSNRRRRAVAVGDPRTCPQHRRLAAVRPRWRQCGRAAAGSPSWTRRSAPNPGWPSCRGRFWFSLDDGRGDVSGLRADVGVHVFEDGPALLLAGRDTGVRLTDVIATLIDDGAAISPMIRGNSWRITELDDLEDVLPGASGPHTVGRGLAGAGGLDPIRTTVGSRWARRYRWDLLPTRVAEYLRSDRGADGDHSVALGAGVRSGPKRSPTCPSAGTRAAGSGVRRELALAGRERLHRQSRLRALGSPTCGPTPRLRWNAGIIRRTGTSSAASGRAAARRSVRCWSRPETGTGARTATLKVSGCSTTSATLRRSTGSRSRRSAPKPT